MYPKALILPRPELTKTIRQAMAGAPLTVVTAPAGYGKTTLARALRGSLGESAFYYLVPVGPHDAHFLWHDMFERFEEQGMSAAAAIRRRGFPTSAARNRQVFEQLRSITPPLSVLIDDYHHVTDPAVSAFWESVARTEIPGFRLVLFSRARPDMNLEELRIKGLAMVYDQQTLAFSRMETEEYYRIHGVTGAPKAAVDAWRYSEGWPAALWLCLQSWQACGALTSSPDIEALLATTVFSAYDEDERTCLMRLSVMDSFTEGDAERLSCVPRPLARLRTLREKNAFLCFDASTGRYQFHSIFRDFLRKELAAAAHIDKPTLYRAAGECCMERMERLHAMRHFLRAGRVEDGKRLLDIFLLPGYDRASAYAYEEIFAAVNALPWEARAQNPLGYLSFIANGLTSANDTRTLALLEEAEERFSADTNMPEYLRKRVQGELTVIRGLASFSDLRAIKDIYIAAWRLLRGPSVVHSMDPVWNYGCPCASFIAIHKAGDYEDTAAVVEQIWTVYVKLSGGIGKAAGKIVLAELLLERCEFAEAKALFQEMLPWQAEEEGQMATALTASFALARIAAATGNTEAAAGGLERLRPGVEHLDIHDFFECLDMAAGYMNACLGRCEAVPQWLRDGEIHDPLHNWTPFVHGFALTVHGKTLLLRGEYRRLADVARDIPTSTSPLKSLFGRIHGSVLQALAAWHTRGRAKALPYLREALELSRPDGIVLSLAEYGGHLVPLLRHLKRESQADAHLEKVLTMATRMARVADFPKKKNSRGLLTPREREFMHCVVRGMSNPAIAKSMGVAEITVVKALGLAYGKLGAANRAEAARRFVEVYGQGASPASLPG